MALLDADLKAHDADIAALLKRNMSEANSLGLEATPVFLIGPFKVAKALDYDEFKADRRRLPRAAWRGSEASGTGDVKEPPEQDAFKPKTSPAGVIASKAKQSRLWGFAAVA